MEHTPHTVGDMRTRTVVAIGQDAPFAGLVETMQQRKVTALPVLAGEGRAIGLVPVGTSRGRRR
ncbi:CBS domain-containing protein [Streptomyces sp. NPDC048650]|uniref:CBS domain-containing protein n=1 Tax=unclassified Streptomyces TaxID=2593676 RepID=UPI00371072F3